MFEKYKIIKSHYYVLNLTIFDLYFHVIIVPIIIIYSMKQTIKIDVVIHNHKLYIIHSNVAFNLIVYCQK